MQNLSLFEGDSQPLVTDRHLSCNYHSNNNSNLTIFLYLTETKSYAPIAGCVLEHILTTNNLTNYEKLYYLLADSIALISKNKEHSRVASLSSEDWAKRLGCSRSLVFTMQSSLVKKGYFIINKDFDEIGRNKRNLIIPTLPDSVFNYLNEKYPARVGGSNPYNPLTECKRSYLDRTKLFIRLNYDLLKIITSNEYLNAGLKVIWLSFYTRCYKNYMLGIREGFNLNNIISSKNNNNDYSGKVVLSFITSYNEIAATHSCDTKCLSKSIRKLEELGFIKTQNFYIRKKHSDNYDDVQERQDKSLWKITITLPKSCILELDRVKDRSNLKIETSLASSSTGFSSAEYIDSVIEELETIDGSSTIFTKFSLPDISFKNPPIEGIDNTEEENYRIKYDPHVVKSGLLLNKYLKTNNKNIDNKSIFLKRSEFCKNFLERKVEKDVIGLGTMQNANHKPHIFSMMLGYKELSQVVELSSFRHSLDALKLKTVSSEKTGEIIKFSSKTLKSWYPLTSEQVNELNFRSGRQFSLNFANQLLLKLATKYPTRVFAFKNQFMSYMTKAFLNEKHQGPMVNHDTFRFVLNDEEGRYEREKQKYLSEVEYSHNTSKESQLRRKIAGRFESNLAYQLLTSCRFDHFLGDNIFKVALAHRVNLTEHDKQLLTNEIKSVYGELEVTYTKLQDFNNFKESKTQGGQGDFFGSYIKASHRLDGEIYLEELDQDSAWYKIRQKLKSHFGADVDRSWFSRLIAEEKKELGKILLKAPTNFIKDWINDNYGLAIAKYCKIITDLEFDKIITDKLPETV